jgi:hypothetical protein
MTHDRLIDNVSGREGGTDPRRQQQLEPMGGAFRRVIRRSRYQPADGDVAKGELALARFGSNAQPTAAARRRLLPALPREPRAERIVRGRSGRHRVGIAAESDEPNGSVLDPADFAVVTEKPKATITVFKDAP